MNVPTQITPGEVPDCQQTDTFTELEAILDDLRTRYDETPQWEFCEGFMVALICCRRQIALQEYLPVLLATPEFDAVDSVKASGETRGAQDTQGSFADDGQRQRFLSLWAQRWNEVTTALDNPVETLEDENCYTPELVDLRSAVFGLTDEERLGLAADALPAFAQVWALGFMFAVEAWPEEWAAPRDIDAAKWLNASLDAIVAMTEDDTGPAEVSPLDGKDATPSTSIARLNAFGDAIWATYDLREMTKAMGPRVETVRKAPTPGRNDLCHCGSGKKYKKCHGSEAGS